MPLSEVEMVRVVRAASGMGLLEAKRYVDNRKLRADIGCADVHSSVKSILHRLMPMDGLREHEREHIELALKIAHDEKYPPTDPPWKTHGTQQS